MGWSLSLSDSWKLGLFQRKILEYEMEFHYDQQNHKDLGPCRLTQSGGECEVKGHYLKPRLVDHCLINNKVMLGQETQYTYQSTKVWLK